MSRGRCGLPFGNTGRHQVVDAAVGLFEQHFHQLPGIGLRQLLLHVLAGVLHEFADRFDLVRGPDAGLLDAIEHVHHPGLPGLVMSDVVQQAIIFTLVLDDVAAQVKNG